MEFWQIFTIHLIGYRDVDIEGFFKNMLSAVSTQMTTGDNVCVESVNKGANTVAGPSQFMG